MSGNALLAARGRWPRVAGLLRFLIVWMVLVAPWPSLGKAFAGVVGAVATAMADPWFAASNVTFLLRPPTPTESAPDWSAIIHVKQDFPDGPVTHAGAIDLRRAGYLQLATFVALAAAWLPRGRRSMLVAASAAVAVVSVVIAVPVVDFLTEIGAVHPGAWVGTALSLARRALVAAPGMAYAVPGLVWLAVAWSDTTTRPWKVDTTAR